VLTRALALILFALASFAIGTDARADFAEGVAAYEAGNYGRAYEVWLPLAEQGDPDAQLAMGILYENGRGVSQDYGQAISWYTKAADAGNPGAQFNLGNMYHEGIGVPADSARAVIWWTLAAEQGLPAAMLNLGIAYHLGDGVTHDPARAFELFKGAAEAGIPAAQFSAAYAYELGLGTEQNLAEARRLYTLAAEAGLDQAAERLIAMDRIDVEPLAANRPAETEIVTHEDVAADDSDVAAVDSRAETIVVEGPAVDEGAADVSAQTESASPEPTIEPVEDAETVVATAAVEEVTENEPAFGDGNSYIQLAAFLTESRAELAWRELSSRHPDLLGDLPYRISRIATSGESGAVYGLQVGPMPDEDEARAICNVLKARSADCFLTGP